jgi:hypothetical protein
MTNEITASKAELKLDLQNASLNVLDYVPERIVPPVIVMTADSNYITPETVGNTYSLGLKLTLVAENAVNSQATEKLDELICNTLNALADLHYLAVSGVNAPYRLAVNNAEYFATDVNLNLTITI